jgi:hypothetical protein
MPRLGPAKIAPALRAAPSLKLLYLRFSPREAFPLRGSFRYLFLYDVAEAIRLDLLGSMGFSTATSLASDPPAAVAQHLRFERPPLAESLAPFTLQSGERAEAQAKYYDYGVVSIEVQFSFECDWDSLVPQSARWNATAELENRATELLRAALQRIAPALVKPVDTWLREDYSIIQLHEVCDPQGGPLSASALLAQHAGELAQLVRAESVPLSDAERQEVLQSSISYSQNDVLIVGWLGALVYGSSESTAASIQLLEYANTQLLEFRYYDGLLTELLSSVYRSLERQKIPFSAWSLSRDAAHLNTIRLDVMELTERIDNAIKFLSDMFYARLYGLISAKVGVPDYRRLVDQKLRTAGELYRFMVDQFNQSRSFVLELLVVIILVIELFFLFRGK